MMQILIDIPKEVKDDFVKRGFQKGVVAQIIENGIILPNEHGRLIDADAFISTLEDVSKRHKYKELLIDECLTVDDVFKAIIESLQNEGLANGDAPTIIESNKNEERRK